MFLNRLLAKNINRISIFSAGTLEMFIVLHFELSHSVYIFIQQYKYIHGVVTNTPDVRSSVKPLGSFRRCQSRNSKNN